MTSTFLALLLATPAAAAVTETAPDSFTSRHETLLPLPPEAAWAALIQWNRWWSPAHTYSGKPPVLQPTAGGALAENWPGGTVQHATVLTALPPKLLRLSGGFGPLQALPVNAVLDFALKAEGTGTRLVMTYRVGGPVSAKLPDLAVPVDAVMGGGFVRLTRFATTGNPE